MSDELAAIRKRDADIGRLAGHDNIVYRDRRALLAELDALAADLSDLEDTVNDRDTQIVRLEEDIAEWEEGVRAWRDERDALQRENAALRAALNTAWAFIDASPCDPDITAEQCATHGPYLAARAALASVPTKGEAV